MSATINANDLKFTIFGAGHDYTLADSGEGEKVFFSHPFVPKGARAYAGQYLIYAPVYDDNDETVPPVVTDVVKSDRAHCTFTPSLGTVFNTVGQQTIKIHYRREYVYPESTILVEKELEQTIEIVDHGTIDHSEYLDPDEMASADVYTDGYVYIRPNNDTVTEYQLDTSSILYNGTKLSVFPWRTIGISFVYEEEVVDISEWEYADTRSLTSLYLSFPNLTNIEALSGFDVSKVTYFKLTCKTDTLEPLEKWNTSSLTNLYSAFNGCSELETLKGIENWDVSHVTNMSYIFGYLYKLKNISALSNWDVSSVTDFSYAFSGCQKITSLDALSDWDVSSAVNMMMMFAEEFFLSDISGLSDWDVSNVVNMKEMFLGVGALRDLSDISGWDVSNVKATPPTVSNMPNMFKAVPYYHSNELNKDLVYVNSKYRDYEGNNYTISDPSVLVKYSKDASAVEDWDVQDIPAYAFNNEWSNIPSWN